MKAVQAEQEAVAATTQIGMSDDNQYLTFILAGEEYGVDILRVQEIKGWDKVTPIPKTPEYLQGVINLRGAIIPIIDLRSRFEMDKLDYGPTTVVIVLRVQSDDSECIMGIVVDAVSDVYNIPEEDLRQIESNGRTLVTESVRSIATVKDKMVILLDIDHLLNAGELATVNSSAEQQTG